MKRYFFIAILLLTGICVKAQKEYLYYVLYNNDNQLKTIGDELNKYASQGYVFENMYSSDRKSYHIVLSKDKKQNNNLITSYVYIYGLYHKLILSGDIPSGLEKYYEYGSDLSVTNFVLNELGKNGFQLEHMSYGDFLFSKKKSGSSSVRSASTNDENVTEKARYNLEGMPVDKNQKGIQIIVYSDYSTKVINVK